MDSSSSSSLSDSSSSPSSNDDKIDQMDMEDHIVFEFALIVVSSLEYFIAAEIEESANQPMDSNDGS